MDLIQISNLPNLIPNRNINHAMMNRNTQTLKNRHLLASTGSPCGDKRAEHFACEGLFDPEAACGVPEGFPLCGEVAVAGGDAYGLVLQQGG